MDIAFLLRHQIDEQKWNYCIDQSALGLPYGYTWYLDIVAQQHWSALVMNDYEAVLPLPYRSRFHLSYLYQPAWTQQLGIFAVKSLSQNIIDAFWAAIPTHFRWIELYSNGQQLPPNNTTHLYTKERPNYLLSLSPDYAMLRKQYHNGHLRNLRKAEKRGLIACPIEAEALMEMAKPLLLLKNPRLKPQQLQQLLQLLRYAEQQQMSISRAIFDVQNQLHAVQFCWFTQNRIVNLISFATNMGRESGAMFLLMDSLIQQYSNQTICLDFEGSTDVGVARFYAGFGATPTVYWHTIYNRLPWYVRWWKKR